MESLLIALDSDFSAKKVALIGYEIGKAAEAEITLLHVVQKPTYFSSPKFSPIIGYDNFNGVETVESDSLPELVERSESFLSHIKLLLGDESIKTIVKSGDYWENILEAARELKVDLIVMGTHSRKGIDKLLSGSVAEKVLHHSLIPILIVPVGSVQQ
ncbi:MAG TPA: universal stress protein [Flavisolibacter sp.]|nr:universal stress protein [Flavisolibacter sp.]HWJ90943.1 universal stress protein [Flavisolibacter sp.]